MTTATAVPIPRVAICLNYEDGEGYLLVPPDADPLNLAAVFRLVGVFGWEELGVAETGDEVEVLEDGTTKVVLVRSEGC